MRSGQVIKPFQALRFVFISLIFLHHAKCFVSFVDFPWILGRGAAFAVSFFIVLSGFLAGLRCDRFSKFEIKTVIFYLWNKLKRFSPLFILLTVFCALSLNPNFYRLLVDLHPNWEVAGNQLLDVIRNCCYLQAWTQESTYSLLGVGWFLSVMMFLWMLTPLIGWLLCKIRTNKYLLLSISIVCLIAVFVYGYLCQVWEWKVTYMTYNFPPSRLFEYIGAMSIGVLMCGIDISERIGIIFSSVIELLSVGFAIFALSGFGITIWNGQSAYWMLPSVIICLVFYSSNGVISRFFSFEPFVALGTCSMEFYLIHQFAIHYIVRLVHPAPAQYVAANVCGFIYCLFVCWLAAFCLHGKYEKS